MFRGSYKKLFFRRNERTIGLQQVFFFFNVNGIKSKIFLLLALWISIMKLWQDRKLLIFIVFTNENLINSLFTMNSNNNIVTFYVANDYIQESIHLSNNYKKCWYKHFITRTFFFKMLTKIFQQCIYMSGGGGYLPGWCLVPWPHPLNLSPRLYENNMCPLYASHPMKLKLLLLFSSSSSFHYNNSTK